MYTYNQLIIRRNNHGIPKHFSPCKDGSETSYAAVAQAAELAKAFGGKITVVQVLALDPYIAAEYISATQTNDLIERARTSGLLKTLEEAAAKFQRSGHSS